jgi:hypothetical protein
VEGDGPTVFAHACKMGLEWLKSKNPACAALKRGTMMAQPQRM